jgi:hypothetical protein
MAADEKVRRAARDFASRHYDFDSATAANAVVEHIAAYL